MLVKRLAIFTMAVLVAFLNVSCSTGGSKAAGNNQQEKETGGVTPSVTVYLLETEKHFSSALGFFDGVIVKAKFFSSIEEYKNKMTTEVLAGEGPDIFIIRNRQFSSVQKFMSSGILIDLNQLISEDSEFDISQYQKTVLDSGIYEGKRYLIPNCFCIPVFYTAKSNLDKNGIKISPNNWDWETMVNLADSFIKENKGTEKYLFEPDSSQIPLFNDFVKGSNIKFIDYQNKKTSFNSSEFIELLQVYKEKIYPAICPLELADKYKSSQFSILKNDKVVMMFQRWYGAPQYICGLNSAFRTILGEDMEVFPMPSYIEGSDVVAANGESFGISSKCKYEKAAFKYIKTILSKEFHKQFYNYSVFATVNKDAFEEELTYYSDSTKPFGGYSDGKNSYSGIVISQSLSIQLRSLMGNIIGSEFTNLDMQDIVSNEVKNYLNGKNTAEQTAKAINNKALIYLNE